MKISVLSVFTMITAIIFGNAIASEFPTRPIRMIVPFDAGGTATILARAVRSPSLDNSQGSATAKS